MVTVPVGGSVTWTNQDSAPHTATAQDREVLQSGTQNQGESYTQAFDTAGTYEYFCEFHPNMKGTIVVQYRWPLRGRQCDRKREGVERASRPEDSSGRLDPYE